jgi:hypothetical protein
VKQLSPHDSWWDLPNDLLPGPEILLCKFPPPDSFMGMPKTEDFDETSMRLFRAAAGKALVVGLLDVARTRAKKCRMS